MLRTALPSPLRLWPSTADGYLERSANGPGGVLLRSTDGQLEAEYVGLADVEQDVAVCETSRFHLASIAKQFLAFAIASLEHAGDLDLDAPLSAYFPDTPAILADCRLRHLLFHTSGIRDQWVLATLAGARSGDIVTTSDVLRFVRGEDALNFDPGTAFRYCNTGYTLLADVVTRVTGQSFNEAMRSLVLSSAGMEDSFFVENPDLVFARRVRGYGSVAEGALALSEPRYGVVGATGLRSTALDMVKWGRFLQDRAGVHAAIFERFDQVGQLDNGDALGYGFGQFVGEIDGEASRFHGGYDYGFNALFVRTLGARRFAFGAANGSFPDVEAITLNLLGERAKVAAPAVTPIQATTEDLPIGVYAASDLRDARAIRERANGEIWLDWMQGFELHRTPDGRCIIANSNIELSVDDQAVLTVTNGVQTVRLSRVDAPCTDEVLCGAYANRHLGSLFSLDRAEDSFTVRIGRGDPLPASVFANGLVIWRGMWAVLKRDEAGDYALVSHPRCLSVRFDRVCSKE